MTGPRMQHLDEDAVIACTDLAARTGARDFQIGYLSDDGPPGWYAYAGYRGARISVDGKEGPEEAADALARRLLTGGKCMRCRRPVALSDVADVVCQWRRMGARWQAGCEPGAAGTVP